MKMDFYTKYVNGLFHKNKKMDRSTKTKNGTKTKKKDGSTEIEMQRFVDE
jgi:hypothetical protein